MLENFTNLTNFSRAVTNQSPIMTLDLILYGTFFYIAIFIIGTFLIFNSKIKSKYLGICIFKSFFIPYIPCNLNCMAWKVEIFLYSNIHYRCNGQLFGTVCDNERERTAKFHELSLGKFICSRFDGIDYMCSIGYSRLICKRKVVLGQNNVLFDRYFYFINWDFHFEKF